MDRGWLIPFATEWMVVDNTAGGKSLTSSVYRPSGGSQAQTALVTVASGAIRYLLSTEDPAFIVYPSAALAIGSTKPRVATGAFYFNINGTIYSKAAVAAGTIPGNDVVPQNKYGAVALDIGADGTIDAVEATDNATGYDTAVLAVAGLPAVEAAHIRLGNVTAMKSDGTFTFGTTNLDAANTTVAYTSTAASTPGHLQATATEFWLDGQDCIKGFRGSRESDTSGMISVSYFTWSQK